MDIDVYSKPGCIPCRFTKRTLDEANVTYAEHDVTTDPAALQQVRDLGYVGVPVVTVALPDGVDHWHGHKPDKLAALAYLAGGE